MSFWDTVEFVSAVFGKLSFIGLVLALIFHKKLEDWFLSKSEHRQHRLAVVREHDRVNAELRSQIMLELFKRKIAAHEKLRTKGFEAAMLVTLLVVQAREKDLTPEKADNNGRIAMAAIQSFQQVINGFNTDLSPETVELCDRLGNELALAILPILNSGPQAVAYEMKVPGYEQGSTAYNDTLSRLTLQLNAELKELYLKGFELLITPRESTSESVGDSEDKVAA